MSLFWVQKNKPHLKDFSFIIKNKKFNNLFRRKRRREEYREGESLLTPIFFFPFLIPQNWRNFEGE